MFKFLPQSSNNRLNLATLLHRNITQAVVQNLLVRFEAQLEAPMASSVDSTDSYNGDDAWCFLHEWDKVLGHHWEVTQETKHLEVTLAAS